MEIKLGDIVKFQLNHGGYRGKKHTGDVVRIIPDSEKDPHCKPELNYDYVVEAPLGGRIYEVQIRKDEILEML